MMDAKLKAILDKHVLVVDVRQGWIRFENRAHSISLVFLDIWLNTSSYRGRSSWTLNRIDHAREDELLAEEYFTTRYDLTTLKRSE